MDNSNGVNTCQHSYHNVSISSGSTTITVPQTVTTTGTSTAVPSTPGWITMPYISINPTFFPLSPPAHIITFPIDITIVYGKKIGAIYRPPNTIADFYYITKVMDIAGHTTLGFIHKGGVSGDWHGPFVSHDEIFNTLTHYSQIDLSDTQTLRDLISDVNSYCTDKITKNKIIMALMATGLADPLLERDLDSSESLYKPFVGEF